MDRSIKNPEVFVKTNVLGTAVLLNCARAAWELPDGTYREDKRFLHVSTDEVYGSLEDDGTYFYETTPYAPHSAVFCEQGVLGHAGEGVYRYLSFSGEYYELLQ